MRSSFTRQGTMRMASSLMLLFGILMATIMLQKMPLTTCPKWPAPTGSWSKILTSESVIHQCSARPTSVTFTNIAPRSTLSPCIRLKTKPLPVVIVSAAALWCAPWCEFSSWCPTSWRVCTFESSNSAWQRRDFSAMMSLKDRRSSISATLFPTALATTKPVRKTKLMHAPTMGSLLPTQRMMSAYKRTPTTSNGNMKHHRTGRPKWTAVIVPSMVNSTPESEA
mmetsp:Transcript_62889/g.167965  ORF Transcript_62889/g.167965 Transcript_62889/m.167965 type:complete len:224 (-) Transcript_62889:68-739(-)